MHELLSAIYVCFIVSFFLTACQKPQVKLGSTELIYSAGQSINHTVGGREFTWQFSCNGGDCLIGTFIGGDYWIAPKNADELVTLHAVTPEGEENGMMENPDSRPQQGFLNCNEKVLKFYNPSLNLMTSLPVSLRKNTSLIKAAKRSDKKVCWGNNFKNNCCVDSYDVLTVLTRPIENSNQYFRPGFAGSEKKLFNINDLDLKKMPSIREVAFYSKRPDFREIGQRWNPAYVDHYLSFMGDSGRSFAPNNVIPNYGAQQNKVYLDDLLSVFGPESINQKLPAVTGLVQRGLDLYTSMENGVVWPSGAGQQIGRKPPMVLFATLINDSAVKAKVNELSGLPIKVTQEDSQVRVISKTDGGIGEAVWGDVKTGGCTEDGYWTQLFHEQQYDGGSKQKIGSGDNKRTCGDPYGWIDGPAGMPGSAYMACCSTGGYIEYAFAQYLMPSLCEVGKDTNLIRYVNRVLTHGILTQPDICAPPDPRESIECKPFKKNDSSCLFYRKTWGPDSRNVGQCIRNTEQQRGRFPSMNGKKIEKIYNEGNMSIYLREKLNLQKIPACNIN